MKVITSPNNETIKMIKHLRENDNVFWWEGVKFFEEVIKESAKVKYLLLTQENMFKYEKEIKNLLVNNLIVVSERIFEKISYTKTPQGIGGIIERKKWTLEDILKKEGPIFFLDGLQDPGNVGTIIRISDAFGFSGVLYKKNGVSPYNEKAVRSSAGSILRVPCYCIGDDEIEKLEVQTRPLYLLDADANSAINIKKIKKEKLKNGIFFLGKEGKGLEVTLPKATRIFIPIKEQVNSLNVAVTAGIVAYILGEVG
jgi:TrmH family RNA methyltransferase